MTSYLQAEGLTKSFGERVLFENLSLAVGEGQRIGLIAKNGTGKTTLLNILAGKEDYEAGRITRRRDLKIAYLEQDPKLPAGKTVLDACLTGDSPALRAIAAYELALGSGDEESLHRAMAEMDAGRHGTTNRRSSRFSPGCVSPTTPSRPSSCRADKSSAWRSRAR